MTQRVLLIIFNILFIQQLLSQNTNDLDIIDISKHQIALMSNYQNEPIASRNKILIDSLYKPYQELWNGYLGDDNDFTEWINNTAYGELDLYKKRSKTLNLTTLFEYIIQTSQEVMTFTDHRAKGKWYFLFGPKWTNAGGIGNGIMLVDLAYQTNDSQEKIIAFFVHEINHQIYSNYVQPDNNKVLYRIINEGLATYVDYLYHKGEKTRAQVLSYSQEEYNYAIKKEETLLELIREFKNSNDTEIATKFSARDLKFKTEYPGAIGYFLGFRIIEEYIKHNGEQSWKEIYNLTPKEVLKKSDILKDKE